MIRGKDSLVNCYYVMLAQGFQIKKWELKA